MGSYDVICISQSEIVRYEEYSKLELDRIDLFRELVQLRFAYMDGAFRGHLDVLNKAKHGRYALGNQSTEMLNIWNLPGLNGILLSSFLGSHGFKTGVINFFDGEWDRFEQMYRASKNPLVVLCTTFHLSYVESGRMLKKLRALDPDMEVAVGGPFINEQLINKGVESFARAMQKYKIDYLIHAFNGEDDLLRLLQARRDGRKPDTVNNLVFKDGNNYTATNKVWNQPSLNTHKIRWGEIEMPFVNKTVQLRTAVSCPFSCAFCSYPQTAGKHITSELEMVDEQLSAIAKIPGVEQVIFIDDTFNVPVPRFREMLKVISKHNLRWYSFIRAQYVDAEIAKMMRDSGCEAVYLGIESFDDGVLKNMNKKVTQAQYLKGIEHMKNNGINLFAALVLGFPGETEQTMRLSAKLIGETGIDFYSLKLFYYMPHTTVHQRRADFGLEGMGNKWKHDTMSSTEAYEMSLDLFKDIKDSIYVDADTSLWYLAYLRDQGFSMAQVRQSQVLINKMMTQDNAGDFHSKEALMRELQTVVQGTA